MPWLDCCWHAVFCIQITFLAWLIQLIQLLFRLFCFVLYFYKLYLDWPNIKKRELDFLCQILKCFFMLPINLKRKITNSEV